MKAKQPQGDKDGPRDPTGRKALLPLKNFLSACGAVMCPHCMAYDEECPPTNGPHVCPQCQKVFHLLVRGQYQYLTSTREIIHEFLWN